MMCFGVENELDIVLGNYALRAQPTDKSGWLRSVRRDIW